MYALAADAIPIPQYLAQIKVTVQLSSAIRDLMLIQQNKFY